MLSRLESMSQFGKRVCPTPEPLLLEHRANKATAGSYEANGEHSP